MSELSAEIRGLATDITEALPKPAAVLGYALGEVESVTAGVVTVATCGDLVTGSYYGPLPAVGATVGVLFVAGSAVILGTPNGFPTF